MGPIIFASILLTFFAVIILYDLFKLIKSEVKISREKISRIVDLILIFVSISVILLFTLWEVNFLDYKSPMPYSKWKEITYNDFKGLKKPYRNDYYSATIVSKITVKEKKDRIIIESKFYPSRSYVFNKKINDKYLLTHEIYHFHITECSARMMRKEVMMLIEKNRPFELDDLFDQFLLVEDSLQDQYDQQCAHGLRLSKQIEWQNNVDSILRSYNNYSSKDIYLKN